MKPFLTNKGSLENPEIMLQDKGKKPTNIWQEYNNISDTKAIHLICKTFQNGQSIKEIRRNLKELAPPT